MTKADDSYVYIDMIWFLFQLLKFTQRGVFRCHIQPMLFSSASHPEDYPFPRWMCRGSGRRPVQNEKGGDAPHTDETHPLFEGHNP